MTSYLYITMKKLVAGSFFLLIGMAVNAQIETKNINYVDTLSGREVYFPYSLERRIYVEKTNGKWYYSKETINQLSNLYNDIYVLDINFQKYFKSKFWYKEVLGVSLIKWIGLLLLLPICYIAYLISKKIYYLITNKYFKNKFKITKTVQEELRKSSKIFGLYIAAKTFIFLLPQLRLPVAWNAFLLRTIGIAAIILLIALINKLIDAFASYLKGKANNENENQLFPIINRLLKAVIWVIGILYILEYIGVNVITLLTGLSIGGLALALAAQDTVKNLIGSVMIFIDKPFQIDDWVIFNDIEGAVEEIGIRSTRIRTFENSLVYVPNSLLSDNIVNNNGLRNHRLFKTLFTLKQTLPVKTIDAFILKLKEIVMAHPNTVKDDFEVCLNDIKDGLPVILFYCYFDIDTYKAELQCRQEILSKLFLLTEEQHIEFALPSTSVYLKNE